jgi:hypothetical protein
MLVWWEIAGRRELRPDQRAHGLLRTTKTGACRLLLSIPVAVCYPNTQRASQYQCLARLLGGSVDTKWTALKIQSASAASDRSPPAPIRTNPVAWRVPISNGLT